MACRESKRDRVGERQWGEEKRSRSQGEKYFGPQERQ